MLQRLRMAADQVAPVSGGVLLSVVVVISLLIAFPVVDAVIRGDSAVPLVITLAAAEVVVGVAGAVMMQRRGELVDRPASQLQWRSVLWLVALCLPWAALIVLTQQAAYLGFVLYFLALWMLPPALGPATAMGLAVLTGLGLSVHHGMSAPAFVGPIAAAGVLIAVVIGLRALVAETSARGELIEALENAQARLAESEREAGRLAERARLGRELHDTVAQHLSSIQLLLHAAERVPADEARGEHLHLARDAAASALADTRAFIRDLTPTQLAGQSLSTAIHRVAVSVETHGQVTVKVDVEGTPRVLPTATEATILRITQEALSNVQKHADATSAEVRLTYDTDHVSLEVSDDGRGFNSDSLDDQTVPNDSFGIVGMRTRAAELGGYVVVVGEPGEGTLVSAQIPAMAGNPVVC